MTEICQVGPEYAPRLAALWTTTFEQAYHEEHSAEDIRAYCTANYTVDAARDALADADVVCKVAFGNEGEAVGYYLLKHHECPVPLAGGSSELKQIYILGHFVKIRTEYLMLKHSSLGERIITVLVRWEFLMSLFPTKTVLSWKDSFKTFLIEIR